MTTTQLNLLFLAATLVTASFATIRYLFRKNETIFRSKSSLGKKVFHLLFEEPIKYSTYILLIYSIYAIMFYIYLITLVYLLMYDYK